jgi:hypothetical protein
MHVLQRQREIYSTTALGYIQDTCYSVRLSAPLIVEKLGDMGVEVARAGSLLPRNDKWMQRFLTAESMFVGGWSSGRGCRQ